MKERESKFFDRRVVERYVQKDIVKPGEFQEHMKNLPDDTANAVYVQLDLHDTELGDSGADQSEANEDS